MTVRTDAGVAWCAALVAGLMAAGVRRVVLSPGSRSTPLVLACTGRPGLRVHRVLDERGAAFFALGLAKAEGAPVMVLATSGSGPANWYPALIEATRDAVPLVLVSADRPAELQECGANQTVDQLHLFGPRVRGFFQAGVASNDAEALRYAHALGARAGDRARRPWPGPVHVNVPLREPLVPPVTASWSGPETAGPSGGVLRIDALEFAPRSASLAQLGERLRSGRGVIACGRGAFGDGFAVAVTRLARRLAAPILADPLSGLRFGGHDRGLVLTCYDAFLRSPEAVHALRPDWVLRIGETPVSKPLATYLAGAGETLVAIPHGPWSDPAHRATRVVVGDPAATCAALGEGCAPVKGDGGAWPRGFLERERRCRERLAGMAQPPLEAEVFGILGRCCPAGSLLFCGNSMPIRDADGFLTGGPRPLRLLGNRGVSGIDGNVSTVLGMAAAGLGPVVGVLGDLTLLHDVGGLLAAPGLDAVLVVFNNGGGAIFGYLPQADLPGFEADWLMPARVDLARLAAAYGIGFQSVREAGEFATALEAAWRDGGVVLIEVVVDRMQSLARHRAYWAAAADQTGE